MSNVIIPYQDADGTMYGAIQDLATESFLNDFCAQIATPIVRTAPFGEVFASIATLQAFAGWGAAVALPSGLQPRRTTLGVTDTLTASVGGATYGNLASVNAIVGDTHTWNLLFPTGSSPFPTVQSAVVDCQGNVLACAGESRSSN